MPTLQYIKKNIFRNLMYPQNKIIKNYIKKNLLLSKEIFKALTILSFFFLFLLKYIQMYLLKSLLCTTESLQNYYAVAGLERGNIAFPGYSWFLGPTEPRTPRQKYTIVFLKKIPKALRNWPQLWIPTNQEFVETAALHTGYF